MNLFDGTVPTPREYIDAWKTKYALLDEIDALEQDRAMLQDRVRVLQEAEQTARMHIAQLSHTLSKLYELSGTLAAAGLSTSETPKTL